MCCVGSFKMRAGKREETRPRRQGACLGRPVSLAVDGRRGSGRDLAGLGERDRRPRHQGAGTDSTPVPGKPVPGELLRTPPVSASTKGSLLWPHQFI